MPGQIVGFYLGSFLWNALIAMDKIYLRSVPCSTPSWKRRRPECVIKVIAGKNPKRTQSCEQYISPSC
jgi:hypothetical protein